MNATKNLTKGLILDLFNWARYDDKVELLCNLYYPQFTKSFTEFDRRIDFERFLGVCGMPDEILLLPHYEMCTSRLGDLNYLKLTSRDVVIYYDINKEARTLTIETEKSYKLTYYFGPKKIDISDLIAAKKKINGELSEWGARLCFTWKKGFLVPKVKRYPFAKKIFKISSDAVWKLSLACDPWPLRVSEHEQAKDTIIRVNRELAILPISKFQAFGFRLMGNKGKRSI